MLKAAAELTVSGYRQLARMLRGGPLIGLQSLIQHLLLGVLVLQHRVLGGDPRRKVQRGFLVGGAAHGVDQLLQIGKARTGVAQRRARYALQHGRVLTLRLQLRCRRARQQARAAQG